MAGQSNLEAKVIRPATGVSIVHTIRCVCGENNLLFVPLPRRYQRSKPRSIGHDPLATNNRPRTIGHKPPATNHRPRITGHEPPAMTHAACPPQLVGCLDQPKIFSLSRHIGTDATNDPFGAIGTTLRVDPISQLRGMPATGRAGNSCGDQAPE